MLSLKRTETNRAGKLPPARSTSTARAWVQEPSSQAEHSGDMLQRQKGCSCGGGCPRCLGVQVKLKVNPPGDRYEREADMIAERLMRMPAPLVQRAPT